MMENHKDTTTSLLLQKYKKNMKIISSFSNKSTN
jgi:hypothetical protein